VQTTAIPENGLTLSRTQYKRLSQKQLTFLSSISQKCVTRYMQIITMYSTNRKSHMTY